MTLATVIFAAEAAEEEGGSFLVSPGIGLMVWTLFLFGVSMFILYKVAFPRIAEALDKRQRAIEDSIDTADRTRKEADLVVAGKQRREELLVQARKDIETETRRAIQEIRAEVADMTILATEKVTRKTLTSDDQRRLVEEAVAELDFAALSAGEER